MKSIKIIITGSILIAITACTPMIYGVPQERWDLMTEKERIVAMETYKERQIANQMAAAERARIRAEQDAARQAQLDAEMLRRQERVDLIYRGKAGTYGDLIKVTLYDGKIRLNGKKRGYSPVTFNIADGEVKSVPIYYSKGRKAELFVFYENRHLWIDTDRYGKNTRRAGHLVYNKGWASGVTYTEINSHGSRDVRGVKIDIDVVKARRGQRVNRQPQTIVIKEKVIQAPPQVIVKEKVVHAPPTIIVKEKVIIKDKTAKKPAKVVVKDGTVKKSADKPVVKEKPAQQTKMDKKRAAEQKRVEGVSSEATKPTKTKQTKVMKVNRVHVELNGGKVLVNGKMQRFTPVNFWIAEGETKYVKLIGNKKSATQKAFNKSLKVSLRNGQLYFNDKPGIKATDKMAVVSTEGPGSLSNVQVKVSTKKKK
jgi:hypothetical protein